MDCFFFLSLFSRRKEKNNCISSEILLFTFWSDILFFVRDYLFSSDFFFKFSFVFLYIKCATIDKHTINLDISPFILKMLRTVYCYYYPLFPAENCGSMTKKYGKKRISPNKTEFRFQESHPTESREGLVPRKTTDKWWLQPLEACINWSSTKQRREKSVFCVVHYTKALGC